MVKTIVMVPEIFFQQHKIFNEMSLRIITRAQNVKKVNTATKPQERKGKGSERLRGKGHKIKFIDLRFERGQVVGFWKGRRKQDVP